MNKFNQLLNDNHALLTDGPMETRIEYGTNIELDKEISIFLLAETTEGRTALNKLYTEDINSVKPYKIPIILNAPLFRASAEHCRRLHLPTTDTNILQINKAGIDLVKSIQNDFQDYANNIIITAPVGPKYAGFSPDYQSNIKSEIEYHSQQIACIDKCGVDVISIAVMPSGTEAIGAAIAASQSSTPYTVGFAIRADGCLLDGMPAHTVIEQIEDETNSNPPIGYIIGCTHPSIAAQALKKEHHSYDKIIGIKANGSCKPPKELLELKQPLADPPEQFASELLNLGEPRGFKIYGGCCGTDSTHLAALTRQINLLRS